LDKEVSCPLGGNSSGNHERRHPPAEPKNLIGKGINGKDEGRQSLGVEIEDPIRLKQEKQFEEKTRIGNGATKEKK